MKSRNLWSHLRFFIFVAGASLLTENNFQKNDDSTKQQAFELLHKHYSCLAETILPGRFFDLHMAILNLVLQRHDKQALEALRLDMILLPVTAKEELHRLLKFMTAVSLDTSLTLDSSVSFIIYSSFLF